MISCQTGMLKSLCGRLGYPSPPGGEGCLPPWILEVEGGWSLLNFWRDIRRGVSLLRCLFPPLQNIAVCTGLILLKEWLKSSRRNKLGHSVCARKRDLDWKLLPLKIKQAMGMITLMQQIISGEDWRREFYPLLFGEGSDGEEGRGIFGGEWKKEFPPKNLEGIQVWWESLYNQVYTQSSHPHLACRPTL